MKNISILLTMSLFFISCKDAEDEPIGCCLVDIISPSQDNINFSASANATSITTESNSWWITDMRIDGVAQSFGEAEIILGRDDMPNTFQFDFFQIERQDKLILINVDKNTAGANAL